MKNKSKDNINELEKTNESSLEKSEVKEKKSFFHKKNKEVNIDKEEKNRLKKFKKELDKEIKKDNKQKLKNEKIIKKEENKKAKEEAKKEKERALDEKNKLKEEKKKLKWENKAFQNEKKEKEKELFLLNKKSQEEEKENKREEKKVNKALIDEKRRLNKEGKRLNKEIKSKEKEEKKRLKEEKKIALISESKLNEETNLRENEKDAKAKKKEKNKNISKVSSSDKNKDLSLIKTHKKKEKDHKEKINFVEITINNLFSSKYKYHFEFYHNINKINEYKTQKKVIGEVKEEYFNFLKDNNLVITSKKVKIIYIDHKVIYLNIHLPNKAKSKHNDVIENNLIDLVDKDYKKNATVKIKKLKIKKDIEYKEKKGLFSFKKETIYIGNVFIVPSSLLYELNTFRKLLLFKDHEILDINNNVTKNILDKDLSKSIYLKEEEDFVILNYYIDNNLINSFILEKNKDYLNKIKLSLYSQLSLIKKDFKLDLENIYLDSKTKEIYNLINDNFSFLNITQE